jgi:hypothetical protein
MANNLNQLMRDDTAVTEQFLDTMRGSHHLTPERDLVIAILEDAIYSYRKYRWARDPEGRGNFREAEEWIMEGSNDWIFSFNSICEILGPRSRLHSPQTSRAGCEIDRSRRHGVNAGNHHERVKRPPIDQFRRGGQ